MYILVDEIDEEVRKLLDNAINERKCINCKHRPIDNGPDNTPKTPVKEYVDLGLDEPEPIEWDYTCPYVCGDSWYNRMPEDDDFCSKFEKKE